MSDMDDTYYNKPLLADLSSSSCTVKDTKKAHIPAAGKKKNGKSPSCKDAVLKFYVIITIILCF